MDDDERFCTECGNPRDGIVCPSCGNKSRRSFCSVCNTPLNELAHEALNAAKADKVFQRAEMLAGELKELEQKIQSLVNQSDTLDRSVKADVKSIADHYSKLFDSEVVNVPDKKNERPQEVATYKSAVNLLEAAIQAYKEKAEELQHTIDSMLPPAGSTPEEQRNFFSARKIRSINMETVRQQWVCNLCGCYHNHPSECAAPELGGTWIMAKVPSPVTSIIYN